MIFQTSRNVKRFLYQQVNPEIYICKMETADYKKLLHDNIIKTYKKLDQRKNNNINKDAKKMAVLLDLEDRIEKCKKVKVILLQKTTKNTSTQNVILPNKPIKVGHWYN